MKGKRDKITRKALLDLYLSKETINDGMIATKFGVSNNDVQKKRKKLQISQADIIYARFMAQNSAIAQNLNEDLKKQISSMDISKLSSAVAHYIFRNGPVEDMHVDGKLSQEDMKTLNIYMNDRIATLIHLIKENDWLSLALFIEAYGIYGADWDKPVLQTDELDKLNKLLLKLK